MSFSEIKKVFFEMWRFEECPVLIRAVESGKIIFFNEEQSKSLWHMFISSTDDHLMTMNMDFFLKMEHTDVDFDNAESGYKIFDKFDELSESPEFTFMFFDIRSVCLTPYPLLKKYWNEFFLPSDETAIVATRNNKHFLFSYEERFFIASK